MKRCRSMELNQVVVASGLAPWHDILFDASHSQTLDLIAASERVVQRDPAWRRDTHLGLLVSRRAGVGVRARARAIHEHAALVIDPEHRYPHAHD